MIEAMKALQFIQIPRLHRPPPVLDLVNHLDQPRGQWGGYTRFHAKRDDVAENRIYFSAALPHGQVAPDAAVRLG